MTAPHRLILRFLCGLALSPAAAPALAGPWPRAPGEALIISSLESNLHLAHWGEYGLSPNRWLSLELDFPPHDAMMEAALSLNQALPDWRGWKSALSFGAALRAPDPTRHDFDPEPALQIGGALGRGFETPLPGWLALSMRYREGEDFAWIKTEATLGLRPSERLSLMGQLQFSAEEDGWRRLKLQSSGVLQLTPKFSLEIGLSRDLWGPERRTVGRIASWIRF